MGFRVDKNPVIAASEINEFVYCPMAFFLRRAGMALERYEPDTLEDQEKVKKQLDLISAGRVFHEDIAVKVEKVRAQEKLAQTQTGVGFVLLALGVVFAVIFYLAGR